MKKLYKYRRLAGIFLLTSAVAIGVNSTNSEATPEETIYIVQPGDTLWSIASKHCSDEDNILAFIHELKTKNNISADLDVGQKIKIGSRPHESQSKL